MNNKMTSGTTDKAPAQGLKRKDKLSSLMVQGQSITMSDGSIYPLIQPPLEGRGSLILTLGVISLVGTVLFTFIFGIFAFPFPITGICAAVMGWKDYRLIICRKLNRSDEVLTVLGLVMGIISLFLYVIIIISMIFIFIIFLIVALYISGKGGQV